MDRSVLGSLTTVLFLGMLIAVAVEDWRTMKIPNRFVFLLLLIGLISTVTIPGISLHQRVFGMFSASTVLLGIALVVPGAFGGGDIKLMGACGLFLGWKNTLLALFLAVLAGGFYGIYLLAVKKKSRKEHFAFGPFLCVGMVIAMFWGKALMHWYLGLFDF